MTLICTTCGKIWPKARKGCGKCGGPVKELDSDVVLIVDGERQLDLYRYSLNWHGWHGKFEETLFKDGKRVTKEWSLKMDVRREADPLGEGSVNTA